LTERKEKNKTGFGEIEWKKNKIGGLFLLPNIRLVNQSFEASR